MDEIPNLEIRKLPSSHPWVIESLFGESLYSMPRIGRSPQTWNYLSGLTHVTSRGTYVGLKRLESAPYLVPKSMIATYITQQLDRGAFLKS